MKDTWLYRRGDIYLVDLGKPIGSVQGGCRPAVVIQNDIGNQYGPTLIVAPITSRIWKKAEQPTHCRLDKMECLSDSSMVLLEQITTIAKLALSAPPARRFVPTVPLKYPNLHGRVTHCSISLLPKLFHRRSRAKL